MASKPHNSDSNTLHTSNVVKAEFGTNNPKLHDQMKLEHSVYDLAAKALASGELSPQAGGTVANAEAISAQQSSENGKC